MQTEKILLTTTITAAAALPAKRLVNFQGAPATASDAVLGVANASYNQGEHAGVDVRGCLLVEAGGAITAGAEVQSDAQGRAIAKDSGPAFGRAMDAATAAGDFIRVLL